MLIKVTEANHWEHERWSYILDADLQGAQVINDLLSFIRLCNEETAKIKKAVHDDPNHPWVTDMFQRPMYKLFAASTYSMRFYDRLEEHPERGYPVLISNKSKLHMNGGTSYKTAGAMLNKRISPARIYSALIAIRDHKENKLYKSFEDLFLKHYGYSVGVKHE